MTGKVSVNISIIVVTAAALFAFGRVASAQSCDRACLLEQARQFNANMLDHTTEKIPLGPMRRSARTQRRSCLPRASGPL